MSDVKFNHYTVNCLIVCGGGGDSSRSMPYLKQNSNAVSQEQLLPCYGEAYGDCCLAYVMAPAAADAADAADAAAADAWQRFAAAHTS